MKKTILVTSAIVLTFMSAHSQINRSGIIKKKPEPGQAKPTPAQTPPAASVYSLTSARIRITTGNDNKESPSGFLLYLQENNGIWGEGKELYTQQDQSGRGELKINATNEIPLQRFQNTPSDVFTLTNLQNKGLRFVIYYYPNFFTDAWKIEGVTITLEFKDQYGNLHSTMGTKTIQFNIPNGVLSNTKSKMTGATDGFVYPSTNYNYR
ncbi:MAG: hypothetical protein HC854_18100 [Flavobacterium sp.]|nr:hypothetical protein [Flavobacterium sp.]